ncbi:helix-turn-helix domain-containing protein [Novosphingobium mangrovi (ex Hu et al. 2023)]|uniref:Helix-turn-helix domain-containing protein n=1 Tax=Novosphingobium mangrovi (ex Hu et al. 2023) TaxID=2930094 RepID=A0ABT0AEN6_9SPHN|nr:helix-turn-helix domain-containing protein [Novosphingobium mangrovi (ex Hu et al. 2023)]MCJ1961640.1 helix-turn-helix domain-containing protein [Novosphingobium mangrovi (ex Hu et al. 2023)]
MLAQSSNKAKIARRVVEVLQFFDEAHPHATVMDIVRRYDRPQSSTSELLSSLVELGILYKDGQNRSYRPTPRAAMLGGSTQAPIIRDGRLTVLLDRLQAQSGLTVALFGLVGVEAQVFNCRSAGNRRVGMFCESFTGGQTERLTDSAVGRLLLSTLSRPRREGIVRRLNAEAEGKHIPYADMLTLLDQYERKGMVVGEAGFGIEAEICAALLPAYAVDQPMAIGFVYRPSANIDVEALGDMLKDAINQAVEREDNHSVTPLVAAA